MSDRKPIPEYLQTYYQKLVLQLLTGCGRSSCTNLYCASCPDSSKPKDVNQAAVMALGLLRTNRLDLLCPPLRKEASLPADFKPVTPTDFSLLSADPEVLPDVFSSLLSSPTSIISNFYVHSPGDSLGLDIDRSDEFFHIANTLIARTPKLADIVTGSIQKILAGFCNTAPSFETSEPNYPDGATLRCIVFFLLFPILAEPESVNAILRVTGVMGALPNSLSKVLVSWFSTLPAGYFRTAVINIQQQLTILVASVAANAFNVDINLSISMVQGLSILYKADVEASKVAAPLLEFTEFYNDAVNADVDLRRDTARYLSGARSLFVGPGPFLLTPRSKADVIQTEARRLQNQTQQDAMLSMLFSRFSGSSSRPPVPYLILKVHRDTLLTNALEQLSNLTNEELKKPLKVQFIGEPGVDEGGLRQEFFQLVMKEILNEKYGMFITTGDNTLRWFNFIGEERRREYELTGILIGLAFFNGITVDLRFPTAIWKKLLNYKVTLPDLQDIDYDLTHGLNQLLDYPGDDVEEVFCRNWTIEREIFDERKVFELCPDGANIPVTSKNKVEYVKAYVDWILNKSIADQFEPFKAGFTRLFEGLKMVTHLDLKPAELELIVCGEQTMDFVALERRTMYDGYSPTSDTIKAFWKILHDLPPDQQRKFLQFVTGTDRVPVGGLSNLKFVIGRASPESFLPTAHTCFNILILPDYKDENLLREKLLLAIQNSEGFGLI
ncbi:hypothetical protein GEMRC1_007858 [Eukaryota sp. GEM-RC1]